MYEETLTRVRDELGKSCIWFSADETTDVKGHFFGPFLAGKHEADEKTSLFLVWSKSFERTSGKTVYPSFLTTH